ncbi:hypothetical protein Glove_109g146 [Diversispora epigaea]|uniref:Uncharacterized protein n=1 Tax=Diversispora epigaea TaxID=1348612 RepID=A0A397JBM6_9GLOM|nr:hypothetical protein Glove_109g146 [Diversispora epigaea]
MTETAGQLLSHVQWVSQNSSNPSCAYPLFPDDVREWVQFFRGVKLASIQYPLPRGQFPIFPTAARPLEIEKDAETRFYSDVLLPVDTLLETQGAIFCRSCPGLLGFPDFILRTNNPIVAKMPLEMTTRFNLNLRGHHLWTVYRCAQQNQIMITDHNFIFKKKILSQVFSAMACNGLHYGILSNYSDTYFLKREETNKTTLYVSRVVQPNDASPTLRECVYYISQLAINDNAGERLSSVDLDNYSSNNDDDPDDSDYSDGYDGPDDSNYSDGSSDNYDDDDYPLRESSKKTGGSKKVVASSSKRITAI